jgi:hypothetical protein
MKQTTTAEAQAEAANQQVNAAKQQIETSLQIAQEANLRSVNVAEWLRFPTLLWC